MQRARRLASMAVVASLAIPGLSACRSEPATAAYVGASRITEKQVQAVWDDAEQALADAGAGTATMPISRADIVNVLVSRKLIDEVAERHRVTLPATVPYQDYGDAVRLPATSEYVRLYAQAATLQDLVKGSLTTADPLTVDDLAGVHQRLVALGAIDPEKSFDSFKGELKPETLAGLQAAITVRNEAREAAGPLEVTVNPRYQPLEFGTYPIQNPQTGQIYQIIGTELGDTASVPAADFS